MRSERFSVQIGEKALAQADAKAALRTVMKSWLPLSEAVLGMAIDQLPDPVTAAPERLPRLLALDVLDAMASPLSAPVQQVGPFMQAMLAGYTHTRQSKTDTSFLQRGVTVCICKHRRSAQTLHTHGLSSHCSSAK